MPYRRTYRRKKLFKRKKYLKRNYLRRKKLMRPSKYFIHRTTKTYDPINVNAGGFVSNTLLFSQNQDQDQLNVGSLFDEYKIVNVKVKFVPQNTEASAMAGPLMGNIYSAIDYNSDVAVNLDDIQAYKTCKMTRGSRVHTRSFCPKPQTTLYNGLTSAYAPAINQWIPTQYANLPHYCLKYFFTSGTGAGISMVVVPIVQYTIIYRAPR